MMKRTPTIRSRATEGVTLIEILIATVVLAFAMIPVFGLMTTGLIRTDVNVGMTNAVEIATGLMNHILSEETAFDSLPFSEDGSAYPPPRADLTAFTGNVAGNAALDRFFLAPGWSVNATSGSRDLTVNGITYHVWVWIRAYTQPDQLRFGYFENPALDFRLAGPTRFDRQKTLTNGDYGDGFAPWSAQNIDPDVANVFPSNPASRVVSNPWGRVEVTQNQEDLDEDAAGTGSFGNFAKVLIRVSFGEDERRERGKAKDFWLVSFKADLQE